MEFPEAKAGKGTEEERAAQKETPERYRGFPLVSLAECSSARACKETADPGRE